MNLRPWARQFPSTWLSAGLNTKMCWFDSPMLFTPCCVASWLLAGQTLSVFDCGRGSYYWQEEQGQEQTFLFCLNNSIQSHCTNRCWVLLFPEYSLETIRCHNESCGLLRLPGLWLPTSLVPRWHNYMLGLSVSTLLRGQSTPGWRNSGAGTGCLSPRPRPPRVPGVSFTSAGSVSFHQRFIVNVSYVLTVLWRCWSKEKLQTNQKPAWSNLPNQTRDYKMLSNSQTQTSLLHLHPSSPDTTTGRLHIR